MIYTRLMSCNALSSTCSKTAHTFAINEVRSPLAILVTPDGLADGCGRIQIYVIRNDELVAVIACVRHHRAVQIALAFSDKNVL